MELLIATEDTNLVESLKNKGLDINHVRNGFDVIRNAIEARPDAIVLDEEIEGLSASATALWLKQNSATKSVPVIGFEDGKENWPEAEPDVRILKHELTEHIASVINSLSRMANVFDEKIPGFKTETDPLSITLDLVSVYQQRLNLANAMIEIASLQHDLREQSYTVKKILEVAGRVLASDLISIGLLKERVQYVLIRNGRDLDPAYIDELEEYTRRQISEHTGHKFGFNERLVFGRRKLRRTNVSEIGECGFFGHPIFSGGNIIGHLSGLYLNDDFGQGNPGLLSELAGQVALLLTNANLITSHEQYVTELNSVLRAAVETTGINPEIGSSNKSFLLQFLLIVLELCRTDKGCVILFDDETQEILETAILGCDENEVLNMQVRSGLTVEGAFRKLIPVDLLNEPDTETCHISGGKLIAPLVAGDKIMGGLVVLGLKSNVSPVITEAVQTLSSVAGNLIYNRILYQKYTKSSIIEEQLKLAHNIQKEVLPDSHPKLPGWDIWGKSLPAKEVGGDLFDYIRIKGGKQGITIADVCGKSIPASLLMTMTRAFLAAESDHFDKPDEILSNVNMHLSQRMAEGKFVTGCLAVIGDDGKIEYASAGHEPLLIYRASTGTFEELDAEGIAMGILEEVEFECKEFELNPGDIALMYTDGLNEAMNSDRVQFGFENIRRVMRENANESAESIIDAFFNAIRDHAAGAEQSDDTTIIVIKRKPSEVGDYD